jgi:hypothetical protein
MREHLQELLFGSSHGDYVIERCAPGKATLLGRNSYALRYSLGVKDKSGTGTLTPLVNARIFPNPSDREAYVQERLMPLVALVRGREEMEPFMAPVAVLEPLNMALSVFPIDGDLPTLIAATDRQRMIEIFRDALPEAKAGRFVVEDCRIELGQGRQHRRATPD